MTSCEAIVTTFMGRAAVLKGSRGQQLHGLAQSARGAVTMDHLQHTAAAKFVRIEASYARAECVEDSARRAVISHAQPGGSTHNQHTQSRFRCLICVRVCGMCVGAQWYPVEVESCMLFTGARVAIEVLAPRAAGSLDHGNIVRLVPRV